MLILIASKKLKEEGTRIRNALHFLHCACFCFLLGNCAISRTEVFNLHMNITQDFSSVEDGRWGKGERTCRNLFVKSIQGSLKLTSASTFWETLIWNVLNVKPVADLLYPQLVRLLPHLSFSRLKFYVTENKKGVQGYVLRNLLTKI